MEELNNFVSTLCNNTVLVGDINKKKKLNNNQEGNNFLNILSSNGFSQFINKPTPIREVSEICRDHIFIWKNCLYMFKSGVFYINLTDHCFIGLKIESFHKGKE